MNLIQLRRARNADDPLTKQPERGVEQAGLSPMDPPDAYHPPGLADSDPESFHPYLRLLMQEHTRLMTALEEVEGVLQAAKTEGFSRATDLALMRFLEVVDGEFIGHSQEEERLLFPLLHQRLIADGEHSRGGEGLTTAIDVMHAEHLKAVQHAAVTLNLIRLGVSLPEERSARVVIGAGLREAENLVELLRLHLFREDNIVFPAAQRLLSTEELEGLHEARALSQRGHHGHDHHDHHGHGHHHHHHPHEE